MASQGGRARRRLTRETAHWTVTFPDSGLRVQRRMSIRRPCFGATSARLRRRLGKWPLLAAPAANWSLCDGRGPPPLDGQVDWLSASPRARRPLRRAAVCCDSCCGNGSHSARPARPAAARLRTGQGLAGLGWAGAVDGTGLRTGLGLGTGLGLRLEPGL